MAEEYEIIRNGRLAGKDRSRGDILTAEETGKLSQPVIAALVNDGWIKPLHADDEEKVAHLNARLDALAEMFPEILERLESQAKAIDTLTASILTSAKTETTTASKASTATKAAPKAKAASSAAEATTEPSKPRRRRSPRAKGTS